MDLLIRPLIVMEVAVFESGKDAGVVEGGVFALIDTVKRYKGEFVFLWHTDNLYRVRSIPYFEIYRNMVKYIFKS